MSGSISHLLKSTEIGRVLGKKVIQSFADYYNTEEFLAIDKCEMWLVEAVKEQ